MAGTGKHPRARLLAAGAILVPAGLGSGAYLLADRPPSCGGGDLTLTVAAAPGIAPALGAVAARFDVQLHEVRGRCVRVTVQTRDPAQVAAALERHAPAGADVWVPDSSIWPAQVSAHGVRLGAQGTFVAVSPLVLAASRPVAADLHRAHLDGTWRALRPPRASRRSVPAGRRTATAARTVRAEPQVTAEALDPTRDAAGTAATLAVQAALGRESAQVHISRAPDAARLFATLTRTPGDPVLIAPEQSVAAYNAAHPQDPAQIMTPGEGTLLLDHPFAVLATDPVRTQAADALRWTLLSQSAQDVLRWYGFRTTDGRIDAADAHRLGLSPAPPRLLPHPSPAQMTAALRG